MNITVFTHPETAPMIRQLTLAFPHTFRFYDTYDDFILEFSQDRCDGVIVVRKGADGMESARNAKLIQPAVPLIWFSDDPGFGIESYRIGCAFFSSEAINESLLKIALQKCNERST